GDSGNTINTFIVDIKREELGTKIEMSTFINEDDTITLEIETEISSPMFNVVSIGLSDDNGNIINFPLDGINKSEIKSIVTTKSGQTIVLGGIIREVIDNNEKKVPVLGDIPLLGFLFKQKNRLKKKTETIITLTPYIITHPGLSRAQTHAFLNKKSSNKMIMEDKNNLLAD
ncbi:MAG: type II and III secretion system protein, partial [Desulfobacteraceae bacterium]|nr:type II and III secretion system protein [Desulfobacteraceae bacterium]